MELFFKKINLNCEGLIREYAIKDISNYLSIHGEQIKNQIKINHKFPPFVIDEINKELNSYNIPNLLYYQSYIRRKGHMQGIHMDGVGDMVISCAINIPLKGCENSKFTWYSGEYKKMERRTENLVFFDLFWKSAPTPVSTLELDSAHVVRVDRPHSAVASEFEDRWIFTMRFEGNPQFEDIIKNL